MATPKPRFDAYAYPIQPLVDATYELYYERVFNAQQRQLIYEELDALYHLLLRRGVFAEVTLEFQVKEGTICPQFFLGVKQRHEGQELPEEIRKREMNERRDYRDRRREASLKGQTHGS
jgi:hypothetical protein